MKTFALALLGLLISGNAMAADADCKITTTRTLCAGVTEADAFKPYHGKNPTVDEVPKAKDEAACLKEAKSGYEITRKKILKKKVVVAHFQGKEIAKNEAVNDKTPECK